MAEFLAVQVRLGKVTLEQVPDKYRAEVETILIQLQQVGDPNGNPS